MLSHEIVLSAGGFPGLRTRPVLKTALWLQNGLWRSSILGPDRQAASGQLFCKLPVVPCLDSRNVLDKPGDSACYAKGTMLKPHYPFG